MQQRQLRLGDILDDYCPRERRLTNHAVVAMVGDDVKRTRCTTCDTEHEYKQAKVPRQRRKNEAPAALFAQVAAGAPRRVAHEPHEDETGHTGDSAHVSELAQAGEDAEVDSTEHPPASLAAASPIAENAAAPDESPSDGSEDSEVDERDADGDGPIHRRLIRASLPRPDGQQPPARPIPEFTIRQPGGRQNRFRPRHQRGGQQGHQFGGNRSNGNMGGGGPMRGPRPGGGRPGGSGMMNRRGPGGGRKRSK
jgi:hypothetical protein